MITPEETGPDHKGPATVVHLGASLSAVLILGPLSFFGKEHVLDVGIQKGIEVP